MAYTPSQRTTREWPWLVLAVALVCAICIPLWQMSSAGLTSDGLAKWTPQRFSQLLLGPEQIVSYCCFTWACFMLLHRYLEMRRQRRAFALDLLPTEVGVCILPEDALASAQSRTAGGSRRAVYPSQYDPAGLE